MKNIKMSKKLLLLTVITALIPLYVSTLLTHFTYKAKLIQTINDKNIVYTDLTAAKVLTYFDTCEAQGILVTDSTNVEDVLKTIVQGDSISNLQRKNISEIVDPLRTTSEFTDVYLTDANGTIIYSISDKNCEGTDASANGSVALALSGTQNWSDLIYSDQYNVDCMTLSTPVISNQSVIGTANIVVNITSIDKILLPDKEIFGQTARVFLVDSNGLLHSDAEDGSELALETTISSNAVQLLQNEIATGNTEYRYSGQYVNAYGTDVCGALSVIPFGTSHLGLVIEVDSSESLALISSIKLGVIIILTAAAFFAVGYSIYVSMGISAPITSIVNEAKRISNYDITKDIDKKLINRKDEIGNLAQSVQAITDNLKELIVQISATSQNVAASSEELTASSEQTSIASSEIATTIAEIAKGAASQAESTADGSDKLNELGQLVEEENTNIEQVDRSMNHVQTSVQEGLDIINILSEKNRLSSEASRIVQESIMNTNDSAIKISEASSLIASIAEQTNLLSLNAAIEAARAGEAGRGFAVVADQIRVLADQSSESTTTINEIIEEVQRSIGIAVEKTNESVRILEEQTEVVETTKNTFHQISNSSDEARNIVSTLSASSSIIQQSNHGVQDIINTLSAVAEENAAATEQASASVEEQSAMIEQIATASGTLANLAQELSEQIAKFSI